MNSQKVIQELMSGLDNIDHIKTKSLEIMFANDNIDHIKWEDLIDIEFDKWMVLENRGVKFKRVFHPEKECYFITEMDPELSNKKYAYFGLQVHNCKEIGEVLEGHLVELTENRKEYVVGDIFIFPKDFRHKPISYINAKYGVEFLNPNK